MIGTLRPLGDLVEEAAQRLTSAQLHALAARVAAAELREPEPETPFTLATAVQLDVDGTIRRAVSMWCDGAGIDHDIFGAWYLPQLVSAGVPEHEAVAALERVTGWCPRTSQERERAVAKALLADGFTAEQIARAFEEVASC